MSSFSHFFSKKYQNICVSLDVNFKKSLTNDTVSFEQLGPGKYFSNTYLSKVMVSGSLRIQMSSFQRKKEEKKYLI